MDTELQQKLSALNLIERGLERLRSGKGHGPADDGYDFIGSALALVCLGVSSGVMLNLPMPETGLALAGRILLIMAAVIGPLMIYRKLVEEALANKPTWAQVVSEELAQYQPVDKDGWLRLHELAGDRAAVDLDALEVWLSVEQNAVRNQQEKAVPKVLIELRRPDTSES